MTREDLRAGLAAHGLSPTGFAARPAPVVSVSAPVVNLYVRLPDGWRLVPPQDEP